MIKTVDTADLRGGNTSVVSLSALGVTPAAAMASESPFLLGTIRRSIDGVGNKTCAADIDVWELDAQTENVDR